MISRLFFLCLSLLTLTSIFGAEYNRNTPLNAVFRLSSGEQEIAVSSLMQPSYQPTKNRNADFAWRDLSGKYSSIYLYRLDDPSNDLSEDQLINKVLLNNKQLKDSSEFSILKRENAEHPDILVTTHLGSAAFIVHRDESIAVVALVINYSMKHPSIPSSQGISDEAYVLGYIPEFKTELRPASQLRTNTEENKDKEAK